MGSSAHYQPSVRYRTLYFKHFGDKDNHILVDYEYNIIIIIDWEFTVTESKTLVVSSPCMTRSVRDFYRGSNQLAAEDREFVKMFARLGQDDIVKLVLEGRKWRRLVLFLGSTVLSEQEEFETLF